MSLDYPMTCASKAHDNNHTVRPGEGSQLLFLPGSPENYVFWATSLLLPHHLGASQALC